MKNKIVIALLVISALFLVGCSKVNAEDQLKNGYYTAEMENFEHGWKEFVTICVREDTIVTVEYNARNTSGFIKSWDMDYMRLMEMYTGNYPNKYTRNYGAQFLSEQNAENADVLAGATTSYKSFKKLAAATLEQAKTGNTSVVIVP